MRKHVDTIIVIPNQNLFKIATEKTTYKESFQLSNSVLRHGVQSVTDLMVKDGLVNLDFADVETVMSSMGKAMMGTGEAEGEGRAIKATDMALNNPLIDDYSLKGARGLLINITGGEDLTLFEVDEITNKIRSEVDPEAEIINGSIIDPTLEGKIRVSIVAMCIRDRSPESKSVINMVHRIQNRNPGYSDFSNTNHTLNQNESFQNNATMTSGANALKVDSELSTENEQLLNENVIVDKDQISSINDSSEEKNTFIEKHETEEDVLKLTDPIDQNLQEKEEVNGLENFGLEENQTTELFNSETEKTTDEDESFTSFANDEVSDSEDDLEIPAFLRRQKN